MNTQRDSIDALLLEAAVEKLAKADAEADYLEEFSVDGYGWDEI